MPESVEAMALRTEDLFLGALALLRGGQLSEVETRVVNGRRMVIFHIAGIGMHGVEREYHGGPCMVDLRLLKSEVARLKNLAFDTLRTDATGLGGRRANPRSRM